MVESWKSFIRNIQNQGKGWIFGNPKERIENVKQLRTAQLDDVSTVDELWNTDAQATVWGWILNKEQIAKDAEAIVNSKIGQKLIWLANTIWWAPEKWNLGAFSETFERWKERAEQNLAEKKEFYDKNVYEDTAKFEKVAWINEQWEQNIKSQARKEYEAMDFLWWARLWTKKVEDMFPEYWTTVDWQKEYRTDGQYVVNRPVWYTPDLLETMQDAYNSVTYAYAQDWVVLTPDDLKKAYPEYANVSDWTLANFISWCMFDVQNWKRSDIKTVWDAMWAMAMTEWYTNRMDWYLDILSDETILKHGFDRRMAKNKEWEQDMILAWQYLKWMVNEIRATWSFAEGLSDWAILSTYRKLQSEDPEVQELVSDIDKYMTLLEEQEAHDWVQVLVTNIYRNYKDEMSSLKDDIESEDFLAFDTIREVLKEQAPILIWDMRNVMQEMRDQSEEEWWYPLKNVFENLLLWKYYRDNDWNYYEENLFWKWKLVYSRREDWTYIDSEWNIYSADEAGQINKQWFIWRLSTWVVWALTSILTSTIEWATDVDRMVSSGNINQYGHAVAYDIIQWYFWAIMANPRVQYIFAIPWVWDLASNVLWFWIDTIWEAYLWLLQEFWISDWWSLETKDKAQEAWWALWMIFASKTVKWLKDKIKSDPRLRAIDFALKSYLWKLDKVLKIKNKKWLAKLIEEGNKKLEQEKLERQKNRIEQQQTSDTTLAQDVRAWEKSDKIIEKETEKKKETAKEELEGKNTIPLFKLLQSEMAKAKEEFFDEFYEEYKKQAGWEENMDQAVLLEKDLRDMEDPEKKQQLIDKYKEIFWEELLEKNAKEWENFWKEIMELKQEVMDSLKEQTEATEPKTTKDVLEEEKLPGRKPTKRYEKIERKHLDLPWATKEQLEKNPFRYILKNILKDFIEPLDKKWNVVRDKDWNPDFNSDKVVRFKRKIKEISRVMVQERIMEQWKQMAQTFMDKLRLNQKKILDFKKEFFDTDIDYDIKDFFTEFLSKTKIKNIFAELFKKWEIAIEEVYDENWEFKWLEAVYRWEQRIPPTDVRETMELLNDIFQDIQKYRKDWKLLLDEASLYELRKMMKEAWYTNKWKEKAWTFADRAQDLYTIFNDYLDTFKDKTWIWKDIRPYDHAFGEYFELIEFLEPFFNKEWEIKKESRNRLIKIWDVAASKIELLEKLFPWTKQYLELMETWHDFITSMVTFMEKTDYKTWFWRRVLKYGPMTLVMELFRRLLGWWVISKVGWVTAWETAWEEVRNILWRKRPLIKEINEILKQLDLTEEEIQFLKEKRPKKFEKILNDLDANFDEALQEVLWDYERGRQTEEWPKAYDRQGNEVRWVSEEWKDWGDGWESWWPKWPDSWWPDVPPVWWTPKKPETKESGTHDSAKTFKEVADEIDRAEDDAVMDELNLFESTNNLLTSIVEDMVKKAETKKEAKLIIVAAWIKTISKLLELRDSPRVKAAKKDVNRILTMDKPYELLQKKIEKSEWDAQLVYINALYKLMLAWKAPTSMITIDYDYVANKKNIKDSAAYSTEWEKMMEWEMNKEIPTWFWYWPDYDNAIADIVKKMIKSWKREVKDEWITDNATQFLEGMDAKEAWNKVEEDAYTAYDRVMEKDKTTTREQARNIKIKEAEGKRIEQEVWELMDPEDIKKREDLWFSFDKEVKAKNKTRRDNQWATIVNKDKVDYIDWWLTRWTIMISWWAKDWMTRVMVNNLETLSNFPQVEKSLPKNSIIIDSSTWKEYSLADIQRMDIKGETNTKTFEEYYKRQMEEYPEEVQDIFNEKDQVVSSPEWKSEPQETQAEQSTTKEWKTTNIDDMVVLDIEDYNEIKKYKGNLRKIFDEAWPDDYVYFSHNTSSENVDAIKKEWIRSYASRKVDKHWEDSPALNRWTLEESNWYGWNQFYFRMKKSEAEKYWANRAAWIIMFARDIAPEDIVALSRPIDYNIWQMLWKYNKWDLFKYWENWVKEFWYDVVKESMVNKYWLTELWEQFEKETWINKPIEEEKTSNPEDIEEYFKPEKSNFDKDISEFTEEELMSAFLNRPEEYRTEIGEELFKRAEARYDKLTLSEIRDKIEMADMYFWKEIKKKFKDLLKRKEKDEIDHLFWEDKKDGKVWGTRKKKSK